MISKQLLRLSRISIFTFSGFVIGFTQGVNAETYSDGFESGNLSSTGSGFSWNGGKADANENDRRPAVSTNNPKSGKYSLKFTFGGSDTKAAYSEQQFLLGKLYQDIWIKYDIFFPTNFFMRDSGSVAHNKGPLLVWSGKYGCIASDNQMNYESWADGSGGGYLSYNPGGGQGNCPGHFWPKPRVMFPDVNKDLGKWTEIIVHTRFSDASVKNGAVEIWKNGVKEFSIKNLSNHAPEPQKNGVDRGYILGWANTGFIEDTIIYIDNFVVSDNPIVSQYSGASPPSPPGNIQ